MRPTLLAIDTGDATVIAAALSAVAAVAAALIAGVGAKRTRHVERKTDEARELATATADSVRPDGRGTVVELLEGLDDKVSALADAKHAEHRRIDDRISAVVALIAHYLGPPPPGLGVPHPPRQDRSDR